MSKLLNCAVLLVLINTCLGYDVLRSFVKPRPSHRPLTGSDVGDPLFLTPYIKTKQIDKARQLSQVVALPNTPQVLSYSGYLTVDTKFNSNLFFWFFPNANKSAPILLWLQGGPGSASLFGLFVENGPFVVSATGDSATLREYAWTRDYHMIFIDQPVGSGYSFADNDAGFARSQTDIANNLFEALEQFFTMFAEYQKNDFYITGESYAGKYVPSIAYKIHTEGSRALMTLKGIAIGDGLSHPEVMLHYAELLYQVGMFDENEATFVYNEQNKMVQLIQSGHFIEAGDIFGDLMNNYLFNATGSNNHYNFLLTAEPADNFYFEKYIIADGVRKAIHVGNSTFNSVSKKVATFLANDFMQSVKQWLEVVLENYRVLLYTGNLDICVGTPLVESLIQSLNWTGSGPWKSATRNIWRSQPDGLVAGYVKNYANFYYVVVRNAGHMVPFDQPKNAYDMITSFISGTL